MATTARSSTTDSPPELTRVAPADLILERLPSTGKWREPIRGLLVAHPRLRLVAWLIVLLVWAGSMALLAVCWFIFIPGLWRDDTGHSILHVTGFGSLLGIAGALIMSVILAVVPIWGWMFAYGLTDFLFEASVGGGKEDVAKARERVRETEDDMLRRLEKSDGAGLLPLLRYSRAQLEAYYEMGLGQARRAFLNASLAMWLGFLLLLAGIALYIGPVEQFGLRRPPGDLHWLILASAAIIEVVSALFLWVYRSTIGQLTFYYRLQMQSHAAIMGFRIATTMSDADAAKRAVIDKLLAAGSGPERPSPMSAKGLVALATGTG